MIRLLRAEANRLLSRRLTLILLLGVVAVIALFQLGVAEAVTPPSPAEVAAAREGFEDAQKEWQDNHEQYEQECLDSGGSKTDCTYPAPTEKDFGLAPVPFSDIVGVGVTLSAVISLLAAYLLAASSIGAEYGTGSLGNWLTFVPRREKVFASKVIATSVVAAALAAFSGLLMVGLAAIITTAVGQPLTGLGSVVSTAARGIPLTVFAAVLGFCVAMLSRHTVAALGALLGYGIVILGLNIVSYLVPVLSLLKRWQLETNIQAFLAHGHTYYIVERTVSDEGVSVNPVERTLSFAASSGYLAVVLVALLAITLLVFRRRDVT